MLKVGDRVKMNPDALGVMTEQAKKWRGVIISIESVRTAGSVRKQAMVDCDDGEVRERTLRVLCLADDVVNS